jgi:hypothetical protein
VAENAIDLFCQIRSYEIQKIKRRVLLRHKIQNTVSNSGLFGGDFPSDVEGLDYYRRVQCCFMPATAHLFIPHFSTL